MNLIETVFERTSDAETPKSFFFWSTLAAISAVVKRQVYLNKKIYKLYPNIYVMIVGRSGLRKGAATDLNRRLVEGVMNTRFISGRSSIQKIVDMLSSQTTFENGYVLNTAAGIINASELAASFVDDPNTQVILTDLYDSNYHDKWAVSLKKDGVSTLREPYVCMFTGTNEENLDKFLDPASIQGGFIARTLIIKEDEKSQVNPLIDFDNDEVEKLNLDDIIERMKEISKLKGGFHLTSEAKEFYKIWYLALNKKLEKYRDSTGTVDRLHDHVLKVSMLISLSRGLDLIVNEEDLEQAINVCTGCLKGTKDLTSSRGKSDLSPKVKIVLAYIAKQEKFTTTRKELLRNNYQHFDSSELNKIIDTLDEGGIIETLRGNEGPIYKLKPSAAESIDLFLRGKN